MSYFPLLEGKKKYTNIANENLGVRSHWVNRMKRFAQFVHNIPPNIDGHAAVKIAIIDGGVNIERIAGSPHSIAGGVSFRNAPDPARRRHHFPSSFGHGTKMVDCVLQVFPKAKLYIARIETFRGKGQTQPTPTPTSAAEVRNPIPSLSRFKVIICARLTMRNRESNGLSSRMLISF